MQTLLEKVFLTVLDNVEKGTLNHYFHSTAEKKSAIKKELDYYLSKYLAKDGKAKYSYTNYLGNVQETPYSASINGVIGKKIKMLEKD